jgi:hypothetical protein
MASTCHPAQNCSDESRSGHWAPAIVQGFCKVKQKDITEMLKLRIVTGLIMGTLMSLIMTAFITYVNTGGGTGYLLRFLTAWGAAWIAAVPIAIILGPIANRWARRLLGE